MSMEATSQPSDAGDCSALFALPAQQAPAGEDFQGTVRVQRANRHQFAMRVLPLDALVPEDHQARLVWEYVESLDLTRLYQQIRAFEGRAGRDPIDPRILMALWLYATLDGVGSARQLAELCNDHVAYQWICGGVSTNHHTLSDFRTDHVELLDDLLTQSVAGLVHEGLVRLNRVAQDGMRVRANAGGSSFHRRKSLEECQAEARQQVEALRQEVQSDPGASSKRQQAARQRAAHERSERIRRALEELVKVEATKARKNPPQEDRNNKDDSQGQGTPKKKSEPRASTTDPEARVMKMGDGGFRPAHNVQFATATNSQVITGVDVINTGSDLGQMGVMADQHQDRYGQRPGEILVDGGFAKGEDIDKVTHAGSTVYAPIYKSKKRANLYQPQPTDSLAVGQWRQRMGTPQAQEIYKQRASTAECVNAIARNRGMRQFLVRGLKKVRAVVLWFALAHNLVRAASLRAAAALRAAPAAPSA
jgi:transposase